LLVQHWRDSTIINNNAKTARRGPVLVDDVVYSEGFCGASLMGSGSLEIVDPSAATLDVLRIVTFDRNSGETWASLKFYFSDWHQEQENDGQWWDSDRDSQHCSLSSWGEDFNSDNNESVTTSVLHDVTTRQHEQNRYLNKQSRQQWCARG
jgi:hypothetical protein